MLSATPLLQLSSRRLVCCYHCDDPPEPVASTQRIHPVDLGMCQSSGSDRTWMTNIRSFDHRSGQQATTVDSSSPPPSPVLQRRPFTSGNRQLRRPAWSAQQRKTRAESIVARFMTTSLSDSEKTLRPPTTVRLPSTAHRAPTSSNRLRTKDEAKRGASAKWIDCEIQPVNSPFLGAFSHVVASLARQKHHPTTLLPTQTHTQ